MTGVLIFIVAILVVVMIHESGHFLVAKAFDFKATKYFLGFGPTLWSFQRGETEYGVKALPLGGFVKIIGMNPYEEVPAEDQPRSYPNKPRWQRALVIVAGSGTHFVVAFLILFVTAMSLGFPTDRSSRELALVETSIDGRVSPALEAGLEPGDEIVGIGGKPAASWEEVQAFIKQHPGQEVTFTVRRHGERRTVTAHLGTAVFDPEGRLVDFAPPGDAAPEPGPGETTGGFLGVQPEPVYDVDGPIGAMGSAATRTWEVSKLSVVGIKDMFGMVFGGELWDALKGQGERDIDEGPLGIVGAGRIAGESIEKGHPIDLIGLIVGFTVFVGLMNLLPLPPLDGGHLAILAYEGLTKRTVDVRKLIPLAATVISFFVLLFVAVLYLDLARPIKVPF